MRHSPRRTVALALPILFVLSTCARANTTYSFVNYSDDQGGATLSGFVTIHLPDNSLEMWNLVGWSITISAPNQGSSTITSEDQSASLTLLGTIDLTPTEMTISRNRGYMSFMSPEMELTYDRITSESYQGEGSPYIQWDTASPSMGGTDPWVVARVLTTAVPEPSTAVLLGSALLGLAMFELRRP